MDTERQPVQWPPPPPRRSAARPVGLALPPDAPIPPPVSGRRRGRGKLLLGAVLCAVLAVLLGSLAAGRFRADRAPTAVVSRYFAALSNADAPAALALSARPQQGPYLTSVVLRQQLAVAAIEDVTVHRTVIRSDRATTQVSYRLAFRTGQAQRVDDAVELVKVGSSWRLARASTGLVMAAQSGSANRLTFAGRPLPAEEVQVFPGALPLGTDSQAVRPNGQQLARLIDDGQHRDLSVSISDEAKATLRQSLNRALARCLTGVSKDPNCPQPDGTRPIPGSLRGSENPAGSDPPSFDLTTAADGRIEVTDNVSVNGSWRVWDFNNQSIKRSGQADVRVQALASVADLSTIFWATP